MNLEWDLNNLIHGISFGEGRRLKIVETIDEKLIELAEDLLNEEKTSVDLLAKIGEIKGLLINLYM